MEEREEDRNIQQAQAGGAAASVLPVVQQPKRASRFLRSSTGGGYLVSKKDGDKLDELIAKFIVLSGCSFRVVENLNFREIFCTISGLVPPKRFPAGRFTAQPPL